MKKSSDSELIRAYRKGDLEALDALIARHRQGLYGYIMNMTQNRAEADDVFQEVWLRVMRKHHLYRRGSNFGGWLIRIARNLVIDRGRRRGCDASLDAENDEGRSMLNMIASNEPDPREAVQEMELGARLSAMVQRLPSEQKDVFLMRVHGKLPFKAIARIQGVSINTALARMQYALAHLRPLLKVEYEALSTR